MKTAITSLMALMVSLTITLAGTKGNGFGNGGIPQGGVTGNGTQVAHYTATYTDSWFGPVTCTGAHQSGGHNFGTLGQDSFTCTATPAGATLLNVSANETLTLGNIGGWSSDYYAFVPPGHLATAFNAVVSSDGKSYTAVANY